MSGPPPEGPRLGGRNASARAARLRAKLEEARRRQRQNPGAPLFLARPSPSDNSYERALVRAALTGKTEDVRRLIPLVQNLYYDSFKERRGYDGQSGTALHACALTGMAWAVEELLVRRGFDINYPRAFDKATALHLACMNGHPDAVEVLLSHSADVLAAASGERGVFGFAMAAPVGDREKILELLRRHVLRELFPIKRGSFSFF
jgi:ankyrin repeat protein